MCQTERVNPDSWEAVLHFIRVSDWKAELLLRELGGIYDHFYNNQINVRALIGQSAVGYCAGKPTEKSRVFWII